MLLVLELNIVLIRMKRTHDQITVSCTMAARVPINATGVIDLSKQDLLIRGKV